jgi:hypothetical protein
MMTSLSSSAFLTVSIMMTKKEDPLNHLPFSYELRKGDLVELLFKGRTVKTLRNKAALQFLSRVSSVDEKGAQLLMAKATGQFKFGNEKTAKK